MWVLAYIDEVCSDFSVYHRIDDVDRLDAPTFFRLAKLLPAYNGALAARIAERERQQQPQRPAAYPQPTGTAPDGDRRIVGTAEALRQLSRESGFEDMFEIVEVPRG